MSNTPKPPTAFGLLILRGMAAAGLSSRRELAREARVSNSTITRLITGEGQPDPASLEKVAGALGLDYAELMAQAGHGRPADRPVEQVTFHPLAVDIDVMLGKDSPVPAEDRQYIEDVVGKLIHPYRKYLRRRRSA